MSLEIHEGQTIETEDLALIYGGYDQLCPKGDYVVALYANPFSSISKEAREVSVEKYYSERRKKVAFISDSMGLILIVKFFKIWNKPKSTINIFNKEEEAFAWLKKQE